MKRLVVLATLVGSVAYGMDMASMDWTAQLDLRQTASEAATGCTGTCSADTQTMFAAGATTAFDMGNNVAIRTGGVLTQRGYKDTTTGTGSNTVNYTYVDVPVLPEYSFNDMVSAYAGVVVALKATRSCSLAAGGTCDGTIDDKSLVTPFQVGARYNINKEWNARLQYETGAALASTSGAGSVDLKTASVISLGGGYSF